MAARADYDAPRRNRDEEMEDTADLLAVLRPETRPRRIDGRDDSGDPATDQAPSVLVSDLADWRPDDTVMEIVPKRADEFACSRCFLIHPHSRLAHSPDGRLICRDCA